MSPEMNRSSCEQALKLNEPELATGCNPINQISIANLTSNAVLVRLRVLNAVCSKCPLSNQDIGLPCQITKSFLEAGME